MVFCYNFHHTDCSQSKLDYSIKVENQVHPVGENLFNEFWTTKEMIRIESGLLRIE